MFSKVIVVLATVAVISAQEAARYPAGVDPAKCPGFPICDNAALHGTSNNQYNPQPYSAPAPQYYNQAPQPQYYNPAPYSAPQYQAPAYNQYQAPQHQAESYDDGSNTSDGGDKYPAGVNPQACPNYPYCDVNGGHAAVAAAPQAAPLPGFTERLYPAGVSPQSCPNFPICN